MTQETAVGNSGASNKVPVFGRIESVRVHEGRHFHTVLAPAADAFEKPQAMDIRSGRRLGEPGTDLKVVGRLVGYQRTFPLSNGGKGHSVTMWVEVD